MPIINGMSIYRTEDVDITAVVPYARNPRKNSAAVDRVAASIREFGFRQPLVVDENMTIIVGHTRLEAARKLGLEKIPVHIADGLSETRKKAYRIADNRTSELSSWDDDLLKLEMADLREADFDLDMTGFDAVDIDALLSGGGTEGLTDPDEVPDEGEEEVSKPGDVWVLGRHRIICGDCTDADTVAKALNGVSPHLMVTDPPYGVNYDADWRNHALRLDGSPIVGRAVGKVENDDRSDWSDTYKLFPGDVVYVWSPASTKRQVEFYESIMASGFDVRTQIIWAKSHFSIGRGNYHVQHEPCLYAVRKGKTAHWNGDRTQTTLWEIDKPQKSETGHSTQKPVECMRRPIINNSSQGQAVYEPFSGSGTTIIACEMEGRCCHAIEINPLYVDLAVRRWQEFTGESAVLERTGERFDGPS